MRFSSKRGAARHGADGLRAVDGEVLGEAVYSAGRCMPRSRLVCSGGWCGVGAAVVGRPTYAVELVFLTAEGRHECGAACADC